MSYMFKAPSGPVAGAIAQQITSRGYAVLEDYVSPEDLRVAQAFVARAVAAKGGEYAGFAGTKDLGGTFLAALPDDTEVVSNIGLSILIVAAALVTSKAKSLSLDGILARKKA